MSSPTSLPTRLNPDCQRVAGGVQEVPLSLAPGPAAVFAKHGQTGWVSAQQSFSYGKMHPDTEATGNTNCSVLSQGDRLMDFLVATNNCEISSCRIIINSVESSHA